MKDIIHFWDSIQGWSFIVFNREDELIIKKIHEIFIFLN